MKTVLLPLGRANPFSLLLLHPHELFEATFNIYRGSRDIFNSFIRPYLDLTDVGNSVAGVKVYNLAYIFNYYKRQFDVLLHIYYVDN